MLPATVESGDIKILYGLRAMQLGSVKATDAFFPVGSKRPNLIYYRYSLVRKPRERRARWRELARLRP